MEAVRDCLQGRGGVDANFFEGLEETVTSEMEHWLFAVALKSPPNTHWYGYLMGQGEAIKAACDELSAILDKACRANNATEVGDVRVVQLDAEGVKLVLESMGKTRVLAWTMGDEDPRTAALRALYEAAGAAGPPDVETTCKAGVKRSR
jgi:hypothetical protein